MYVNYMLKAKFLCLLLIVAVFMLIHIEETKNSIEAKLLILTHIKSRQSGTSSNKQKIKRITSLWNINMVVKRVTF